MMSVTSATFTLQSDRRPTFHDVTSEVEGALTGSGIRNGILVVFSQHTTCSVLIQEASDDVDYWGTELLMQDLVAVLEGLVPTCRTEGQYRHPGPLHIVAAAGRDEQLLCRRTLPVRDYLRIRAIDLERSECLLPAPA